MKAADSPSVNCIKNKKWIKYAEKRFSIWRMEFLHPACGTIVTLISPDDCNVACGSGIVTVNSPSGSTLQCDTWLWDDMPLKSPKRPPYWNSTYVFYFHTSSQLTCHCVPVCEILFKSAHTRQKKMTSCRFSKWCISATLDCRDPIMGSLKSPVKQLT